MSKDRLPVAYNSLSRLSHLEEYLLLNTCNRLEFYGVSKHPQCRSKLKEFFYAFQSVDTDVLSRHSYWHAGPEVVQHLFEVAAGIDSQRLGETEILGQVKAAYQMAIEQRSVGSLLHRIFQKSFQAAKWVRTHTQINQGQLSIGAVAVGLAERIFGALNNCNILVLGLGEVGQKTLKALQSRGAQHITISSRDRQKAETLAHSLGSQSLSLTEVTPTSLTPFDVLICSAAVGQPIFDHAAIASAIKSRPHRPLFIIDLALPRNVHPSVTNLSNVFLYNLDDLAAIVSHNQKLREREAKQCRNLLNERASLLCSSLLVN